MKNQEILDGEFLEEKNAIALEIVHWWEQKRILYNGLLLVLEILVIISYWEATMNYGINVVIFDILLTNFISNAFYTAGWVLDIFSIYYFKVTLPKPFRKILFVFGTLFTLVIAFSWYVITLGNNGMFW